MMHKKKLLLVYIFLSFLLTGCTVDYRLYIDEKSITESIDTTLENISDNQEIVKRSKEFRQASYFEMNNNTTYYYEMTDNSDDDQLKLNYRFQYLNPVKLQNSNAIGMCYYNKSVVNNDGVLTISTSDQVTCMYKDGEKQIDHLNITIITDLRVLEHNADFQKGNQYVWQITDENYDHKPIYIQMSTKAEDKQNIVLSDQEKQALLILLSVILGVVAIISIKLFITYRSNNKFK